MRYLVQIDPARTEEIKRSLSAAGIRPVGQLMDYVLVDIPPELVSRVRAIPGVIAVVPDRKVEMKAIPIEKKLAEFQRLFLSNPITGPLNAFNFSRKADFGLAKFSTFESRKMVGADVAEADGIKGKGIKVAVLDTGTDPFGIQGPYTGGKSSVEGQPVQIDENGHGTWCQTCISGRDIPTPWGRVKGMAVDAEVAAFKVLGYGIGAGTNSSVMRGMTDALEWGADIMSLSLGGPECEDYRTCPQCRMVSALTKQGIIFVVAAGNCLTEGDWVLTTTGSKPAKDIKLGELLLNYNPTANLFEPDKVIGVFSRWTRRSRKQGALEAIVTLETDEGHILEVTEDHPILVEVNQDKRWLKAKELQVGMHLLAHPSVDDKYKRLRKRGFGAISEERHRALFEKAAKRNHELKLSRPAVICICKNCGIAFEVKSPSRKRRYCSTQCQSLWQKNKSWSPGTQFVKGMTPWMKGLTAKDDPRVAKISQAGTQALLRYQKENPDSFYDSSLKGALAVLRKFNKSRVSAAEKILVWALHRERIYNFKIQVPINLGWHRTTIPDILFPEVKVVVYVDGKWWHSKPEIVERDANIDSNLRDLGYLPIRFRSELVKEKPEAYAHYLKSLVLSQSVPKDPVISKIESHKCRRLVFDIATEKNHTLVVNGIVLHNSGPEPHTLGCPGSGPDALTVGAIDKDYMLADFSSRGPSNDGRIKPDCVAPGVGILSSTCGMIDIMQFLDGIKLASISGTSMSTPHVAGVVALALEYSRRRGKNLTTDHIKEALELYGEPKNNNTGWGLITYGLLKRYIFERL